MRFSPRLIAAVLLAAGAAACSDTRTINTPIPAGKVAGRLSLNPVFTPATKTISASLADFGITFDHVRVTVRNTPDTNTAVLDTTVAFAPSSSDLVLNLTVPVNEIGESFDALVQYIGTSGTIFSGHVVVKSFAPDQSPPEAPGLFLTYVGPGAKLKTLTVAPKPVKLVGSATAALTITATDSSGASLTLPPLVFTSSDESVAKVVGTGSTRSIQSFGKRGQARITATTPIGVSDTLSAVVSLPAASLAVVSGGGQTGTVGTQLAQPIVVQVSASDGVGVPDVSVIFAGPTGSSVGSATAVTDANGRASTTFTLSTVAGPQAVAVSAGSLPATSAPATAKPGPASPATSTIFVNGTQINADNQSFVIASVLTKDQFGNQISTGGAAVTLTTSLGHWGTGTATTTAATDNGDGTYSAQLRSAQSGTATITGAVGGTAIATPSATVTMVPSVLDHFDVTLADGTAIPFNEPAGVATAVRIRALDASGNVVTSYNSQTVLSITGSTLVGGPTIVAPPAVAGVVMTSVKFGQPSQNVRLIATGATKTGQSAAFSVVAGPAALITIADSTIVYGLNQTITQYPIIKVTDGAGNASAGQAVAFAITGRCTIADGAKTAQFTSDGQGLITFNASMLTVPGGGQDFPFSCQLNANGVNFNAPILNVALIVQQGGTTAWKGHTDNAWETIDNWTNLPPSSSTSAFIPAAQPRPAQTVPLLKSDPFIPSIFVEGGAALNLNGHTLNLTQNVDADTTGSIFNGTINFPPGSNGGSVRGILPAVTCQSGTHSLFGPTQVNGPLTISNCTVDVGGTFLSQTQGDFATASAGGLLMNSTSATVQIAGNATFGGTRSVLSAGQLAVLGNFHQSGTGTFAPTGSHAVVMSVPQGGADQSITFDDVANSWFVGLNVVLAPAHTFTINSAVQVRGSLVVTGNGGTLALPAGLAPQQNGRIDLSGPMTVTLGGTINTIGLNFNSGAFTLNGNGTLSLGNGSLTLGNNVQLIINVTGNVILSAPGQGCTAGTGVSITGSNQSAVNAFKQFCHVQ